MAQQDLIISPAPGGLAMREEINEAFEALATFSAGTSPPPTASADRFYFNTTTGLLWKRDSGNTAWLRAPVIPGPVATTAAMTALDGASYPVGSVVLCLANGTPGDGAGGWFEARASGETADGADVFAHNSGGSMRWHRINAVGGGGGGIEGAVYVTSYGATGNGTTDDTAAIQAALDSGVKEVLFPAGTYKVTASLVPTVSQTLRGSGGAEACIISGSGIAGGIIEPRSAFGTGYTQRVRIADLTITATTPCGYGIRLINCPHSAIERVRLNFGVDANVTRCTNDAIYLGDSWGCMLYKLSVYIETASTPPARSMVNMDGGANTTQIVGGEFTGASLYGIWLHNSGAGIATEVPTAVTAMGAIVQRAQIGLYSQRSRGCVFVGTYFEGCQTPVVSGADASSSDRSTSLSVIGGICTAMDGTGYGYGDNATAAIVARRDYAGTYQGINLNEWASPTPENILEIFKAYGTTLINCSRHNYALSDVRPGITFAAGWDTASHWSVIGNGTNETAVTVVATAAALAACTEKRAAVFMRYHTTEDDGGGGWFEARESGGTVDGTDIIAHAAGGSWRFHRLTTQEGGGGAVSSVFGRTGAVIKQSGDYTAADITETAALKIMTSAERTRLASVETGAKDDQTGAEIASLLDTEIGGTGWRGGSAQYIVANYTGLAASGAATTGEVAIVTNDGIAGVFVSTNAAAPKTVNTGTVIAHALGGNRRWERVYDGAMNVRWFGAKLDGVTEDTAAIQAAIDLKRDAVYIPPCTANGIRGAIVTQLKIYNGTHLFGSSSGTWGWPGSRLRQKDGSNLSLIIPDQSSPESEYLHNTSIHDLSLEGAWEAPAGPGGTSTGGCGIDLNRRLGESFQIYNMHIRYFAESGLRFTKGTTPGSVQNVSSFWNGQYGFDFIADPGNVWHLFSADRLSGDSNGLALIRIKSVGQRFDGISITNVKAETKVDGTQPYVIELDTTNYVPVVIENIFQQNVSPAGGQPITASTAIVKITGAGARVIAKNWRASQECANWIDDQFKGVVYARAGASASVTLMDGVWDSSRNNPAIHMKTKDDFHIIGELNQRGTAAPTTGTHYAGEIVWNSGGGAVDYWRCTTSGAPGVWVARP